MPVVFVPECHFYFPLSHTTYEPVLFSLGFLSRVDCEFDTVVEVSVPDIGC